MRLKEFNVSEAVTPEHTDDIIRFATMFPARLAQFCSEGSIWYGRALFHMPSNFPNLDAGNRHKKARVTLHLHLCKRTNVVSDDDMSHCLP